MKKIPFISPGRKELISGAMYMLFELSIMPYILAAINAALPQPLSGTQINIVFFTLNFSITTLIFRNFLKRSALDALQRLPRIIFAAGQGFGLEWLGSLVVTALILNFQPGFANVNDANLFAMAESNFVPMAICTILFAPIAEELLFRGVLFSGFYQRNRIAAFIISILVFSAIHVSGYISAYPWQTLLLCFVQYIPPSIGLAVAYAKSGNIFSPMLMHIVINAMGIYSMRFDYA